MSDLIDRKAAITAICEDGTWLERQGCTEITMCERKQRDADILSELPTIDAEPVRHGQWVFSPDHAEGICTMCNFKIYGRPYNNTYLIVPYNYCPNCGAKMD